MSDRVASLFAGHADELQGYLARRLNDRYLAADLVQDIFLRVAERPDIGTQENVRAYLYKVATNLAIDHERRTARRARILVAASATDQVADDKPGSQQILENRDRLLRVQEALRQLPTISQQIFHLNRVEGLSYGAVARRLGISESSVQKHLARALSHALAAVDEDFQDAVTESGTSNILSLRAALKARRC